MDAGGLNPQKLRSLSRRSDRGNITRRFSRSLNTKFATAKGRAKTLVFEMRQGGNFCWGNSHPLFFCSNVTRRRERREILAYNCLLAWLHGDVAKKGNHAKMPLRTKTRRRSESNTFGRFVIVIAF